MFFLSNGSHDLVRSWPPSTGLRCSACGCCFWRSLPIAPGTMVDPSATLVWRHQTFWLPKTWEKKHISANLSIFLGLLLVSIDLYFHQLHSITLQSITIPLPFCCHTLQCIATQNTSVTIHCNIFPYVSIHAWMHDIYIYTYIIYIYMG